MPKRFNIKSYNKLKTKFSNRTKLKANNMHFSSTDSESYYKDNSYYM